MNAERQVLVVDRADGVLLRVVGELDLLGFRVVWVPTPTAALEFVRASAQVALLIASAAALADAGQDFLTQVRAMRPSLRMIWGTPRNGKTVARSGPSPDSLIPEPFRPNALRDAISTLLSEHSYPKPVADAVMAAGLEVLEPLEQDASCRSTAVLRGAPCRWRRPAIAGLLPRRIRRFRIGRCPPRRGDDRR